MTHVNFGDVEWTEGKRFEVPLSSYRHALTIVCTHKGRHQGTFTNGTFGYFALVRFTTGDEGVGIVPVLPDGRFLMIVEERPAVTSWGERPRTFKRLSGEDINLGEYQSLEFPAGGKDAGESPRDAALRELKEETGIPDQTIALYRMRAVYPMIPDTIMRMHYAVAYLSDEHFAVQVETDGGLAVFAVTEEEIERNIRNGVLADAITVLTGWNFYKTVRDARKNPGTMKCLKEEGYLTE